MVKNPLIQKLEAKIQSTNDLVAQAEYRAEMACYWARSGDFGRAESECRRLRESYGSGSYPRVTILILCAEGLLSFFRDVSFESLDRLARANLLSKYAGLTDTAALSSAWIAHINFNFDRYDEMCDALRQCFASLAAENLAARGRAAVVLSDAFLLAGKSTEARYWFGIAREAAAQMGDHTLVAALTYNRAALNSYLTQLDILAGISPLQNIHVASTELNSAIGYQRVADIRSLDHLLHLSLVGIYIFKEEFEAAWSLAEEISAFYGNVLIPRQRALLSAQLGLCAARTNRSHGSIDRISSGEPLEGLETCDGGDKALVADCCAKIAGVVGDVQLERRYLSEMAAGIDEFTKGRAGLASKVSEFAQEMKF